MAETSGGVAGQYEAPLQLPGWARGFRANRRELVSRVAAIVVAALKHVHMES